MKIKEIALKDFMKWRGSWRIDGFDGGVNKLIEENEYGKSTVLEALKAILQFRHGSSVAPKKFRPFGDKVHPEVSVLFEIGGVPWRITKRFAGQSGRALLESGGRRFEGDAAEDELEQLLGLRSASRGSGQTGVWGALWIDQAQSVQAPALDDAARETLHGAIETQVGKVTGGERGRRILERVRREVAELKGERGPKGRFKAAIESLEETQSELEQRRREAADVEGDVVRLERVIEEFGDEDAQKAIEELHRDLATAEGEVNGAKLLAAQRSAAESAAECARIEVERLEDRMRRRAEIVKRMEAAMQKIAAAEEGRLDVEREATSCATASSGASKKLSDADNALKGAEASLARSKQVLSSAALLTDISRVEATLRQAEEIDQEILRVRAALAANPVTEQALTKLETLVQQAEVAAAALAAGSPDVEIEASEGVSVSVDGRAIGGRVTVTAIDPVEVRTTGLAVRVRPPASADREQAKKKADQARAAADAALAALHVRSLSDALLKAGQRREDAAALSGLQKQLAVVAGGRPEAGIEPGVDGLRVFVEATRQALGELLKVAGINVAPGMQEATKDHAEATEAWRSALASRAEAAKADRDIAIRKSAADERLKLADGGLAEAKRLLEQEQRVLEGLNAGQSDVDLAMRIEAGRTEAERLGKALAEIPEIDVDAAQLKVSRLQRAFKEAEKRRRDLEDERLRLESSLGVRRGSGEAVAELEAKLAEFERAKRRIADEAAVAEMLTDVLGTSEKEAKERYVAPVKRRVMAGLKRLIPDAEAAMNDDMQIGALVRGGIEEDVERLSTGTREQLAVLVRLAFAEMLAENNLPAMLILDDALVYSDDRRLEEMFSILDDASQRLQLLILTCHGRMWQRLPGATLSVKRCG